MVNTRSQTPKRNASNRKSAAPKPVKTEPKPAKSEPKPAKSEPKQKSVRFSGETKKTVHQSRSNCRSTQRGRGNLRSPSPRRSFGLPDIGFPYGVQSPVLGLGHGFGAHYAMPPFGYLNYPNYNPFGFGPQQQYHGNWAASTPPFDHHQHSGKRRRESSDNDDTNNLVESPVPIPAKRIARAKSLCAASPPTKPRGRPPKSAVNASPNDTAVSGQLNSDVDDLLQTPAKRTSRALSTSSSANRIQTPCLKPLDRVPWMQSIPRFGVIDNGQRPIPNLNRIRASPSATVVSGALAKINENDERSIPNLNRIAPSVVASPSASMANDSLENEVGGGQDKMLQTQIRLSTEMMKRVEALEAERKTFIDQIKALQAASDQNKKESAFYKAKLDESSTECNQLKEKLAKRKPDAKIVTSANKENVNNVVQPNNASN